MKLNGVVQDPGAVPGASTKNTPAMWDSTPPEEMPLEAGSASVQTTGTKLARSSRCVLDGGELGSTGHKEDVETVGGERVIAAKL